MKTEVFVKQEVDIKYVRVEAAVRYDEEDIPYDFPGRKGDLWTALIDIDTGIIQGWPEGKSSDFQMKVCDEGTYTLFDENMKELAKIEQDYVPNGLIPGSYGDYIRLKIGDNGKIINWPEHPDVVSDFFPED
jgi:hypothetical protein